MFSIIDYDITSKSLSLPLHFPRSSNESYLSRVINYESGCSQLYKLLVKKLGATSLEQPVPLYCKLPCRFILAGEMRFHWAPNAKALRTANFVELVFHCVKGGF